MTHEQLDAMQAGDRKGAQSAEQKKQARREYFRNYRRMIRQATANRIKAALAAEVLRERAQLDRELE